MRLTFPDIGIIFFLIVGLGNIFNLLSEGELWSSSLAAVLVVTWLMAVYSLTTRVIEALTLERILKTEAAQRAIAVVSHKTGYDKHQAEKTVRALCTGATEENAAVMLMAIAYMQTDGLLESENADN